MAVNKILWHQTKGFHYCIAHGDTVKYRRDAEGRRVAQCSVCGAKLIVINGESDSNTETGELTK